MPTILIVDDDDIIRETLDALLEQYQYNQDIKLDVLQAPSGEEAIKICEEKEVQLLFLDVMMPGLSGSETAQKVKKISPKTMIVAISSLSDENKQNEMLRHGAEDYIIKPIVASLFINRLHNYLRIIQSRDTIGFKHNAINAFTSTIYNYKIEFSVTTDDELAQFWETILIRFEMQRLLPDINEAIRFLYRLGGLYLDHKFRFNIFIEEDKENFYFSMNNIKLLEQKKIETLISNHYPKAVYQIKDNIITFTIHKAGEEFIEPVTPASNETPAVKQEPKVAKEPQAQKPVQPLPEKKAQEIKIYHFLDPDDLDDLDDHLDKLHHIILRMSNQELTSEDCQSIAHFFQIIAQTISLSSETYVLSSSLQTLASILMSHQEVFINQSKNLSEFVLAFVNDLIQWKNMVFYDGAPSIDFMDASIVANIEMITVLLVPQESKEDASVDDIFDF